MNVILITVLLTLLGSGLVVLLVWLSVESWKSRNLRKGYRNELNEIYSSMNSNNEELYKNINDLHTELDNFRNDVDREISDKINIIYDELATKKDVDSRFDKLYNLIKENK